MTAATCIDCRQLITRAVWPGPRDLDCYEVYDAAQPIDPLDPAEWNLEDHW